MSPVVTWLTAITLVSAAALPVAAQDYPTRPIMIVVPYAPGGVTDVLARVAGNKLGERLGQSVIVENKPGGGGLIGTDFVARSQPDGYTLAMMIDTNTIAQSLYPHLNYDPIRDFAPISLMAEAPQIIVANPSFPPNNIRELVAYAKTRPDTLFFASPGVGTSHHLAMVRLMLRAGIKLHHVPYKGGGQAVNDVISGQVPLGILGIAPALPQLKAGTLKALGVTSLQRLPELPNVPTVAESGFPGFETFNWFGLLAPAQTPAPIIQRLHDEMVKVMHDPTLKERFDALSLDVVTSKDPDDFRRFMIDDAKKWSEVVEASGVKLR
jgi:tripartite-type tricarboxylate transporter receptor subunit TctC